MENLKRWLVGLDLSLIDKSIVEYVAFLANLYHPEKIYFVNIQKKLDIPASIKQKFPELSQPLDEKNKKEIKELVAKYFPNADAFDIEYKVVEGHPFDELNNWISIKNIDLFIAGRKKDLKGSSVLPHKVARKINVACLFVPEKPKLKLQEIFIPVDFSDNTNRAFKAALQIATKHESPTLHILHAFYVPQGYRNTRFEEEVNEAMKDDATIAYNEFIKQYDTQNIHLSPLFLKDNKSNPAEIICESAQKRNADLIVIGAKGKSALASLLLGSVTEKIILKEAAIPVLIVR